MLLCYVLGFYELKWSKIGNFLKSKKKTQKQLFFLEAVITEIECY